MLTSLVGYVCLLMMRSVRFVKDGVIYGVKECINLACKYSQQQIYSYSLFGKTKLCSPKHVIKKKIYLDIFLIFIKSFLCHSKLSSKEIWMKRCSKIGL